jgi:hypothetical protein
MWKIFGWFRRMLRLQTHVFRALRRNLVLGGNEVRLKIRGNRKKIRA